ncbi:MAG: peptidase M48, partial [Salinibacter sp.]
LIHPDESAYLLFRFADADTPEAAARSFAGQKGLTILDRRSTTVNGYDAQRVLAEGKTRKKQTLRLLAYFIEYGDRVYQFQGLTAAGQYPTHRGVFERSIESFNQLTDSEILNVQPTRLRIRPAGQRAPFRTFIDTEALPSDMTEADLAILNQVDLGETVVSTRPLKLPN